MIFLCILQKKPRIYNSSTQYFEFRYPMYPCLDLPQKTAIHAISILKHPTTHSTGLPSVSKIESKCLRADGGGDFLIVSSKLYAQNRLCNAGYNGLRGGRRNAGVEPPLAAVTRETPSFLRCSYISRTPSPPNAGKITFTKKKERR